MSRSPNSQATTPRQRPRCWHVSERRDGLLTAVVEAVEREQNERIGALPRDPAEALRSTWRQTSDPSL